VKPWEPEQIELWYLAKEFRMSEKIKKITAVSPRSMGHLHLEFDDGTQAMIQRGDHEAYQPKVGDPWPKEAVLKYKKLKVTAVRPTSDAHHEVSLEDGSKITVERGKAVPRVGDFHLVEDTDGLDEKASETPALQSEPAIGDTAKQDEGGTAQQPGDGAREEGQQSAQAKQDGSTASEKS
jgi:hypothetical protein